MTATQAEAGPATDDADEAVDSLLVHITARASALQLARLSGDRAGTVAALREIASLTDGALAAAGAGPEPAATDLDRRRYERWLAQSEVDRKWVDERLDATAAPEPAVETPADNDENSLVPLDPDSPAGKVAARLTELLGKHVTSWYGTRRGVVIACPEGVGESLVAHLNAIRSLLPDFLVRARMGAAATQWLFVTLTGVIDGIEVEISNCAGPGAVWDEERTAMQTWLAELGVEVTP